jgi:hypothetical protein
MYSVGLDADTRAYFTAATSAILLLKILSVNTPPKFFSTKNHINNKYLILYNKYDSLQLSNKKNLTKIERNTKEERSIFIGLLLSDA